MNKKKIKQVSAIILIIFLILIFGLAVYFALIGNIVAALSAIAFNAFFSIILYFLIKLNKYITNVDDDKTESSD